MSALTLLRDCGEIQKKLFFAQFFQSGKSGEITCVNGVDNEDTILFERFENFIVCYRLWCEDSCDSVGKHYLERPVADFVAEKGAEQSSKYKDFLRTLVLQKKTLEDVKEEILAEGGDPSQVDLKEFTRFHLEEMLQPGRKRINGDRNSRIQIMHRHIEVPNDLQKPAISAFVLPLAPEVDQYYAFTSIEEKDAWVAMHLSPMFRDEDIGCHLPMLTRVVDVYPTIYRFPEKEVDLSNNV
jgi:hypothetical protein